MKRTFSAMAAMAAVALVAGCGSAERWESLPVSVFFANSTLNPCLVEAVAGLNEGLGVTVFEIREAGPVMVECAEIPGAATGKAVWIPGDGGTIESCVASLEPCPESAADCRPRSVRAKIVAHELWHCLGFTNHSETQECLSQSDFSGSDAMTISEMVCPEMVEAFNDLYHGVAGGSMVLFIDTQKLADDLGKGAIMDTPEELKAAAYRAAHCLDLCDCCGEELHEDILKRVDGDLLCPDCAKDANGKGVNE